ncbi:BnaC03g24400D [Brassica napus]|uniref:BnaC03g24400D protein n=1 Tax=Brassica napus TaxID=3708 RepID=A0A078I509_BRANA|nr:BnaC03g24400D [Brassica napus]
MSCRINLLMVLVIIALINTETSLGRLVMEGSAGVFNGFRTLTNTKKHVYGQAFSEEPLPFKNSTNGNVTSFSLTLLFAIAPEHRDRGSHGMAFVISPTRVLYSKEDKQLNVTLSSPEEAYYPVKPLLSLNQDLSPYVLEKMYVGCTASIGSIGALHYVWSIHAYSFLIFPPYPKPESQVKRTVMVTFLTFALFVALVASAFSIFFYKRHKMVKEVLEEWEIQCGPHRFSYKELFKATKDFHDRQLLGRGGFGHVFKGTLTRF